MYTILPPNGGFQQTAMQKDSNYLKKIKLNKNCGGFLFVLFMSQVEMYMWLQIFKGVARQRPLIIMVWHIKTKSHKHILGV